MEAGVEFVTPANVKVWLKDRKWNINDTACANASEAEAVLKDLLLAAGTEEQVAQDQALESVALIAFIAQHGDWYKRLRYE